ncbi:MAG: hypothetical protein V1707_02985 [bacterium]
MSILTQFLNYLFPWSCLGCEQQGIPLCQSCEDNLLNRCKPMFLQTSEFQPPVDKVLVASSYEDPLVASLIQKLKYSYQEVYADVLGNVLKQATNAEQVTGMLVPIPLHPRRFKERGFNQAELLAKQIGLPVINILKRLRYTKQQALLAKDGRLSNLTNAFSLKINDTFSPSSRIILVDDVCTTGSTLAAAAKVIKEKYPTIEVWGLAVAKN